MRELGRYMRLAITSTRGEAAADKNRDAIIDKVIAGQMSMVDAAKALQCRPAEFVAAVQQRRRDRAEMIGHRPSR